MRLQFYDSPLQESTAERRYDQKQFSAGKRGNQTSRFLGDSGGGFAGIAMIHRGYPGSEGRQEYGQGEVLDIGNLVDHLSNDPRIDPRRMGIMGYSRGAHNALLATQRYDNFRAAVLWSAPVDMVDHVRVNPWIAETIGGTARDNPRIYRELSAIHHVDSINCPLLLIYGEPDTLRLVEALKSQGKAVELKCWPLEGHIWSP